MKHVWMMPLLMVVCGLGAATAVFVQGRVGTAVVVVLVFALLAYMHTPLAFPKSVGALEAQRRSAVDGRPVVFWRPGCTFCMRLRMRLGRTARRMYWVDIWRDEEGAAVVRAANDGNETVPTVLVAGRAHTNPDPAWVREQVSPAG